MARAARESSREITTTADHCSGGLERRTIVIGVPGDTGFAILPMGIGKEVRYKSGNGDAGALRGP